jgi:hypothetical protein
MTKLEMLLTSFCVFFDTLSLRTFHGSFGGLGDKLLTLVIAAAGVESSL